MMENLLQVGSKLQDNPRTPEPGHEERMYLLQKWMTTGATSPFKMA
jgi:hypothetical protein